MENGQAGVQVHLVIPKNFNDAQQVADRFKDAVPVILNLQSSDTELSKRLIDFASGLTYALDGGMQRIADKVFLLTPRNVEVSAEERARLVEKGFFNQLLGARRGRTPRPSGLNILAGHANRSDRRGQHGRRPRARVGRAGRRVRPGRGAGGGAGGGDRRRGGRLERGPRAA